MIPPPPANETASPVSPPGFECSAVAVGVAVGAMDAVFVIFPAEAVGDLHPHRIWPDQCSNCHHEKPLTPSDLAGSGRLVLRQRWPLAYCAAGVHAEL